MDGQLQLRDRSVVVGRFRCRLAGALAVGAVLLGFVGNLHASAERWGVSLNELPSLAVGGLHRLAIRSDESLWAWGDHDHGQLGLGDLGTNRLTLPRQVAPGTRWRTIAASDDASVGIRSDGSVWAWGALWHDARPVPEKGRESVPRSFPAVTLPMPLDTNHQWVACDVGWSWIAAIRSDATLWGWRRQSEAPNPEPVRLADGCRELAMGGLAVLARREDGSLWSWSPFDFDARDLSGGALPRNHIPPARPWGEGTHWNRLLGGSLRGCGTIASDGTFCRWAVGPTTTFQQLVPSDLGHAPSWHRFALSPDLGADGWVAIDVGGRMWAGGVEAQKTALWLRNAGLQPDPETSGKAFALVDGRSHWREIALAMTGGLALARDGTLWGWDGPGLAQGRRIRTAVFETSHARTRRIVLGAILALGLTWYLLSPLRLGHLCDAHAQEPWTVRRATNPRQFWLALLAPDGPLGGTIGLLFLVVWGGAALLLRVGPGNAADPGRLWPGVIGGSVYLVLLLIGLLFVLGTAWVEIRVARQILRSGTLESRIASRRDCPRGFWTAWGRMALCAAVIVAAAVLGLGS